MASSNSQYGGVFSAIAVVHWANPSKLAVSPMPVGAVLKQQYNNCKQKDIRGSMSEEAALFEILILECKIDAKGTAHYFNALGQLHREYGPAVKYVDGTLVWYQHGQLHRLDGPAVVNADGTHVWYQDGMLHRLDGAAVEHDDGSLEWHQNGQLHRLGGPAVVNADGSKSWYRHGQRHRVDGPAIERPDGYRAWYQDGQRHRLDGPAFVDADGECGWYINGKELTEAEWQQSVTSMEIV